MVQHKRVRRKKIGVSAEKTKFDAETLLAVAEDLKSGRIPLERVRISDDVVVGLRAVCNKSGHTTLHVSYEVGEDRPFKLLGSVNKGAKNYITVDDARALARTIKALGDKGINVDEENDKRLLRELKRDGTSWRAK